MVDQTAPLAAVFISAIQLHGDKTVYTGPDSNQAITGTCPCMEALHQTVRPLTSSKSPGAFLSLALNAAGSDSSSGT